MFLHAQGLYLDTDLNFTFINAPATMSTEQDITLLDIVILDDSEEVHLDSLLSSDAEFTNLGETLSLTLTDTLDYVARNVESTSTTTTTSTISFEQSLEMDEHILIGSISGVTVGLLVILIIVGSVVVYKFQSKRNIRVRKVRRRPRTTTQARLAHIQKFKDHINHRVHPDALSEYLSDATKHSEGDGADKTSQNKHKVHEQDAQLHQGPLSRKGTPIEIDDELI